VRRGVRHRLGDQVRARQLGGKVERAEHRLRVGVAAVAVGRAAGEPAARPVGQRIDQLVGVVRRQRIGDADRAVERRRARTLHQHRQRLLEHVGRALVRDPVAPQAAVGGPGARPAEVRTPRVAGGPGFIGRHRVQALRVVRGERRQALVARADARQRGQCHRQVARQVVAVLGIPARSAAEVRAQHRGQDRGVHRRHDSRPRHPSARGARR
jgi:hypothetical protein